MIGAAEGELKQSCDLEVSVTDLVLDPNDLDVFDLNLTAFPFLSVGLT